MLLAWCLGLAVFQEFPEASKFLERIGEAEARLKEGKTAEAKKIAEELAAEPPGGLVWWMFRGRHGRFADLAEGLFDAGEKGAARAFLVSVAPLCSHTDAPSKARFARVLRDDPESAFDFVKLRHVDPGDVGLTEETAIKIASARLDAGKATEQDLAFFRWTPGTLELMRKAVRALPKSPLAHELRGDAAWSVERHGEAAEAYAASLALTSEPLPSDREELSDIIRDFVFATRDAGIQQPRLIKLALATNRSQGQAAAEAAVEKHAGAAFPLNVAGAYYRIQSFAKAAPAYRRWLLAHPADARSAKAYAYLVQRLIEIYVKLDRPREAVFARRVLLADFPPQGYRDAGAIKLADVLAGCDKALGNAADRLPLDEMIDELVAASAPTEAQKAVAKRLIKGLSAPEPADRENAAAALRKLGPAASPALKEALGAPDAETRGRARDILSEWALRAAEEKFRRE